MRLTTTLVVLALAAAPASLAAQVVPTYELGVDAVVGYARETDRDGRIFIGTPVDVRVGILSGDAISFEPRLTFNFSTGGGSTSLGMTPTLNVLYQPGKRSLLQRGPYVTGGLGLLVLRSTFEFEDIAGDEQTITQSRVIPMLNLGVGMRRSINQGAFRPEAFVRYTFEDEGDDDAPDMPSQLAIGARLGLSFWK